MYIECTKELVAPTELRVRHAQSLTIQNMRWFVTSQEISEPLIGRPTLEALGMM